MRKKTPLQICEQQEFDAVQMVREADEAEKKWTMAIRSASADLHKALDAAIEASSRAGRSHEAYKLLVREAEERASNARQSLPPNVRRNPKTKED